MPFPWLRWDGRQAVLFDLPARKFYIFGLNFWPQDFVFLAMLLMIAGIGPVLLHHAGRPALVRLCLSADGMDRSVPVDGAMDRRRPRPPDEARRRALEPRKIPAQGRQAFPLAGVRVVDRLHLRRLLHADHATGGARALRVGRLGDILGAVLCAGHLGQRRFPARAGLQVHVPVCAIPERDVRPQHPDHRLRPDARRTARPAQARHWAACSNVGAACSSRHSPTTMCFAPRTTPAPPMPRCRPVAAPRCRSRPEGRAPAEVRSPSNSAIASIARSACRSARPASISAMACSTSASPAAPASMPATR